MSSEVTTSQTQKFTIDIKDDFSLMNIRSKKDYDVTKDEIIHDLQKCFQVVDSTPEVFMFKDYNVINEQIKVSYTSEAVAKSKLKKIIVGKEKIKSKPKIVEEEIVFDYKSKPVSAWDIYLKNAELFTVKGLKFYSNDPHIFSYLRGYDFKQLDSKKVVLLLALLNQAV